jgi:hypothetical protein
MEEEEEEEEEEKTETAGGHHAGAAWITYLEVCMRAKRAPVWAVGG